MNNSLSLKNVLIGGAGGAPSEGVIKSLKETNLNLKIIGVNCDKYDLITSKADRKILIPSAKDPLYITKIIEILNKEAIDFFHFQSDIEIYQISAIIKKIQKETNSSFFLPSPKTVERCVHKFQTYEIWRANKLIVPYSEKINTSFQLKDVFQRILEFSPKVWIRSNEISGGGRGSLCTDNLAFAKNWIKYHKGWGNYIVSSFLPGSSVTWLSIWYNGKLIVAQSRERYGWAFGNRAISGVTGLTKVGETIDDSVLTQVSIKAIKAVDKNPHGIFGVDLTYDINGIPNPTEINIGRFFTTILFFTRAGLNLPEIYIKLGLFSERPKLKKIINPLKPGMLWIRNIDMEPFLIEKNRLEFLLN